MDIIQSSRKCLIIDPDILYACNFHKNVLLFLVDLSDEISKYKFAVDSGESLLVKAYIEFMQEIDSRNGKVNAKYSLAYEFAKQICDLFTKKSQRILTIDRNRDSKLQQILDFCDSEIEIAILEMAWHYSAAIKRDIRLVLSGPAAQGNKRAIYNTNLQKEYIHISRTREGENDASRAFIVYADQAEFINPINDEVNSRIKAYSKLFEKIVLEKIAADNNVNFSAKKPKISDVDEIDIYGEEYTDEGRTIWIGECKLAFFSSESPVTSKAVDQLHKRYRQINNLLREPKLKFRLFVVSNSPVQDTEFWKKTIRFRRKHPKLVIELYHAELNPNSFRTGDLGIMSFGKMEATRV